MKHFPYSIPQRRPLAEEESALLLSLLLRVAPGRCAELDALEVQARCGCGKCPTIMFEDASKEKKEGQRILADFVGGDEASGLVGVILWERGDRMSELEAWSLDGSDVAGWPCADTLRPFATLAPKEEPNQPVRQLGPLHGPSV